ncbi:trichohyalin isoform X2 [Drosophila obscura]|uniref:trichohyalin isoform X2 n=1 Tax=Drosophila obscura TaxID=7282 RepID=UPI001BB2C537|nr:trichohyalin isoform X2 [Drosophila obscura]
MKIVDLTGQITDLTERMDCLSLKRSKLEHSLQESRRSEKVLAEKRAELTASVEESQIIAAQLQQTIDVLAAEKTQLVQQAGRLEDVEKSNRLLVAQLDIEQKNYDQKLTDLSRELAQELAQQAGDVQQLELEIIKRREEYESISKEKNAYKTLVKENDQKLKDLSRVQAQERAQQAGIVQQLELEIIKRREECESISKESSDHKAMVKEYERQLLEYVQSSDNSMAEMLSKIDSLEKKYSESQKNYGELLAERNNRDVQYENERINIEKLMENCRRKLDNQNELYALLLKESDTLKQERDSLTQERDSLTQERDSLVKEREILTEERDSMTQERDSLVKEREILTEERDSLMKESHILTQERDAVTQERDSLTQERDTLTQERDTLTQERDSLTEERDSLLKERDTLTQEREMLTKERDSLMKERDTLTNESHILTQERETMLHERDTLMAVAKQEKMELICVQRKLIEWQKKSQTDLQKIQIIQEQKEIHDPLHAESNTVEARHEKERSEPELMLANGHQKSDEQNESHVMLRQERDTPMETTDQHTMKLSPLQMLQDPVLRLRNNFAEKMPMPSNEKKENLQRCVEQQQQQENMQMNLKHKDAQIEALRKNREMIRQSERSARAELALLANNTDEAEALLKQEIGSLNMKVDQLEKKEELLQVELQAIMQEKKKLQANLLEQDDERKQQLQLYEQQLEESNKRYALLQVHMTDQQKASEERQIQLSQQVADAMERFNATYTADAGEEGLPNRRTLQRDCQVLQAKYQEAKKKIDELQVSLKEQRIEMVGKLEKMKIKMRTLYTTEVTRMKEKQEREALQSKAELEAITCQNTKYEEHTRKLSNQIVRLNERILEQQKQHAITTTQLRHMQATAEATRSSSSLSTLTVSGSATATATEDWQPFKRPTAPSSNLAMEDEEGEVFNNTYLTDLKLGRVRDITEELNYRNSLQPPHLRSTYAAQYDVGSQDEDLKDGPHSLDDSMSALLSSSASTGARKKTMGTHYKRPGPPTPSKNGGRLSFGSSEPPREILRETCENNGNSKTPTRFKMFTSRFSIGSSTSGSSGLPRDERPLSRKRPNLLTGMQRRRLQLRQSSGLFCTSTPRKSRSYYDQRRLICASDAISDQDEDEDEEVEEVVHEQEQEQQQEIVTEGLEEEENATPHLSNTGLLAITHGLTRRLSSDPRHSTPSSGSTPHVVGRRKYRNGRVSLCLHGNIFAKSRPVAKISATAHAGNLKNQRKKLKQQRLNRFDQGRPLHASPVAVAGSLIRQDQAPTNVTYQLLQPLGCCDNNNYSLHNRNEEQQQQQLLLKMGQTVVLKPEEQILEDGLLPVAAATFNVSESDTPSVWQYQQKFERENIQAWLSDNTRENENEKEIAIEDEDEDEAEDIHGGHFERLCRETESTAPFELQPLHYKKQEEQPKRKVRTVRPLNITGTTSACTTNASCATNLTSASSRKSCTIYSLGYIHSEPLPTVTITHVEQRVVQQIPKTKKLTLRDLWHVLCRLNLSGHLILSLVLALIVMLCLCSQVSDRMGLGVTGIATAIGIVLLVLLVVLSLSCGK